MTELLQILAPILLVDIMNPVLLAVMIFVASGARPVLNSLALLVGHAVSYFLAGYLLSFGLDVITKWLEAPGSLEYALGGLLGVALVIWGAVPVKPDKNPDMPTWELTPLSCLIFGAVVAAVGIPFAVPYLGAIDQILKAGVDTTVMWYVFIIYNLGYALPFLVVPGAILVLGEGAKAWLDRLNNGVIWVADNIMPWLIVLLGVWLIYQCVGYFL